MAELERVLEDIIRQQQRLTAAVFRNREEHLTICEVSHSTTQTISDSSTTVVIFDTDDKDPDDLHSTTSNKGRITAVLAGYYLYHGGFAWASNSSGYREIAVTLDNTEIARRRIGAVNGDTTVQDIAGFAEVASGEVLRLRAYEDSGGVLDISDAHFRVIRIG